MLDGKKTYISALILGLATLVRALNWVTQEQYELILGLTGSAGLAALRAGVGKPRRQVSSDRSSHWDQAAAPTRG